MPPIPLIFIELLSKRVVIRQKMCYHTRVKSEGESGVSRHSPDPPQPAWTRVERIQHLPVYLRVPGEDSVQQLACYFPLLPIAGLAPVGRAAGEEHAYEAVLLW